MMFNRWANKIVGQIENNLERGFVKHWLNYVEIFGPLFCRILIQLLNLMIKICFYTNSVWMIFKTVSTRARLEKHNCSFNVFQAWVIWYWPLQLVATLKNSSKIPALFFVVLRKRSDEDVSCKCQLHKVSFSDLGVRLTNRLGLFLNGRLALIQH